MLSPLTDSWYLFSAFPSAGLDADAMSGSDVAFLGHELLVGTNKARYKKYPGFLTFGEAKLHAMAELPVFKQSREIVYVSFVLL